MKSFHRGNLTIIYKHSIINPNMATAFLKFILCYKDNNKKEGKSKQENKKSEFWLVSATSNDGATPLIRVSFGPWLAIVVRRASTRAWNVVCLQWLVTYVARSSQDTAIDLRIQFKLNIIHDALVYRTPVASRFHREPAESTVTAHGCDCKKGGRDEEGYGENEHKEGWVAHARLLHFSWTWILKPAKGKSFFSHLKWIFGLKNGIGFGFIYINTTKLSSFWSFLCSFPLWLKWGKSYKFKRHSNCCEERWNFLVYAKTPFSQPTNRKWYK